MFSYFYVIYSYCYVMYTCYVVMCSSVSLSILIVRYVLILIVRYVLILIVTYVPFCVFCPIVFLRIVCVYMCTVLLPPGVTQSPSSYDDRLDIRTTWVSTKVLSYDPHAGQGQNVRL
jgi:hypothetical protein